MVLRYGGEGATHKVWPWSMQRFPRNLSLQTADACAMTVALLTKSSRAKHDALQFLWHILVQIQFRKQP